MKKYPSGKENGAGHEEINPPRDHDQTFEHLGLSREQIAIVLAAVFCGTPSAQAQQTNLQDCEDSLNRVGLASDFSFKLIEGKCDDGKGAIEIRDSENNIVTSYTGGFREGLPDGYGISDILEGEMTYAGEFRGGKSEGSGRATAFNDTGAYIEQVGEFKDGVTSGYGGSFIYEQGANTALTVAQFGEFHGPQAFLNGMGVELQQTGIWYGEFKDGIINGWGALQNPDFLQFGQFRDGFLNGRGIIVSSGRITIGYFRDGQLNGAGEVFEEGYHFRGEFRDDMGNGQGELILPYGGVLKSLWIDGKPSSDCIQKPKGEWTLLAGDCSSGRANGKGVIKKDGRPYDTFYEGEFRDGILTSKRKISVDDVDPGIIEIEISGVEKVRTPNNWEGLPKNEEMSRRVGIEPRTDTPPTSIPGPTTLDNFGKGGRFHVPSGFPVLPPFASPDPTIEEVTIGTRIEENQGSQGQQRPSGITKRPVRKKVPEKWGDGTAREGHIMRSSDYDYVGEFLYGRKDGLGIGVVTTDVYITNGTAEGNFYIGEWRNGEINGMGVLYDTNKSKPNALFGKRKEVEIIGGGVRFWLDPSSAELSGISVGDCFPEGGTGKEVAFDISKGTTYIGECKGGGHDGKTTSFFPDGSHAHEQRENGEFNGESVLIIKDGGILTEVWHRNILDEEASSFQFKDYEPETLDAVYNAAEGYRSNGRIDIANVLYNALLSTPLAAKAQERLQKPAP